MRLLNYTAGGYLVARRRLVPFLAALALVCGAVSAGANAEPQIAVREERGVYTVSARFEVPQPPSVAMAVLTDFERIPRFMPEVKTSIVRRRADGAALVEQEAVARVLLFSKRVHLLLDVTFEEGAIRLKDTCGHSFSRYEGSWRLERQGHITILRYELEANPAFDVPSFLLTRLLKRDAKEMIERLRAEIAARDERR